MGINASSTISVNKEDGDVTFHMPSAQLSTLGATYSFKAPLPLPEFLREQEDESKDEEREQSDRPGGLGDEEEPVQVAIKTGIVGIISHRKQKGIATYEDDTTKEIEVGDQHAERLEFTDSRCALDSTSAYLGVPTAHIRSYCDS